MTTETLTSNHKNQQPNPGVLTPGVGVVVCLL